MMDATARANYLDRECGSDETLRREVEALLAAQPLADDFLSVPATECEARRRAGQLEQQSFEDRLPVKTESLIGHTVSQYEIVSLLGFGGMGEVWLANDTRLKRKVALKLLPEEFTNNVGRVHRFEQEAYAVSALNHPNIITLFDFGHAEEGYFITTEFVDGQTLRERLRESANLPVREVIEIVLQICSALAAAHEAGIIHRDIKPENIMLRRDGYVKVLDFGLAKMSEDQTLSLSTSASSLTNPGTVMGTISYMSPEQARAQKVDARTDIFSLGIVLYEMLTGRSPFEGETMSDMLAAILKSEPLPLPNNLTGMPAALQQVIAQALVKDRAGRYQTIRALADDLKQCAENLQFQARLARSGEAGQPANRPMPAASVSDASSAARGTASRLKLPLLGLLALVTLLVALLAWRWLQPNSATPTATAPIKTIAVLPFRFLGSERAEEYLGLGITESLITKLSSARQLTVRPTSAVLKYQNTAVEPDRAARELKADAVIEGSVQKAGDKLRVTVQLIRAGEAQPLWADEFNESLNDLFTLQDKLAARVMGELALRLTGAEQEQLAKRPTTNAEAYRLYLQGRYLHNQHSTEGIKQARVFYERAITLDPKFAAAHTELALNLVDLVERGSVPQAEGARQSLTLAAKAVELDDTLAEAHAHLGFIKLAFAWDLPGAETELRRALDLDPRQMDTRQFYGVYLLARGRAEEGIAETRRGVELDPTSFIMLAQLGRALYLGRRYDEVIAASQELLQMDKNSAQSYVWLGQAYTQQGKHAAAIAALEKGNSLASGRVEFIAALGHAYAAAGRGAEARQIIMDLQGRSEVVVQAYFLATVYAGLGERAAALAQLEEAYQRRDPALILRSKLDPKLDPLRNDPAFTSLLQRIDLASTHSQ
ncbi:MAG: protein kinase [Acidobacteria bacterium]|nr:protein kinase [Acidobacteriota bacterium]